MRNGTILGLFGKKAIDVVDHEKKRFGQQPELVVHLVQPITKNSAHFEIDLDVLFQIRRERAKALFVRNHIHKNRRSIFGNFLSIFAHHTSRNCWRAAQQGNIHANGLCNNRLWSCGINALTTFYVNCVDQAAYVRFFLGYRCWLSLNGLGAR